MEASFFDKRFVIVAGKGGVGKSTMCAALGLAAARRGKRTAIAELNTREKASLFFRKPPSGYATQQLAENLYSINIQPDPALKEYALMKLRFERAYALLFDNPAMKRLLRMIPGMQELILLGKAFNMERERGPDGRPAWDMIIVDAPATGHGISLLRLPETILQVARTGPMADEVRLMQNLLLDPDRTQINVVALAEEMPVRETYELIAQIDALLAIPKGYLLINQVWPDLFTDRQANILQTLHDAHRGDPRADGALACAEWMTQRRRMQDIYLEQLRSMDIPSIEVPFLFDRSFELEQIETISDHIIKEAERLESVRS